MINIKKRREQRRFLILLLCIFFLVVSFFLISATVNNHNNKKLPGYDETVTEMPIKFSFEEGRNLANEVKEMSQKYTDAKAWLKIYVLTVIITKQDGEKIF